MKAIQYYLHTITPLHAGGGEARAGVEQCVIRNPATGVPELPGSSIKGVLRDHSDDDVALFGSQGDGSRGSAGAVNFHSANLLALPVRSLRGTFAWATSPLLLRLHRRDMSFFANRGDLPAVPEVASNASVLVTTGSTLKCALGARSGEAVVLEDLDLTATTSTLLDQWWEQVFSPFFDGDDWDIGLQPRLCVVSDAVMSFLCRYALRVDPRNALDEDKAVTNFWHEESLPSESLLAGLLTLDPPRNLAGDDEELLRRLRKLITGPVQFGGNATVGRGMCRVILA